MIKNLNPNKAHACHKFFICMIQLYDKIIVKLLKYLFEPSLSDGIFPEEWKKTILFNSIKKESKNYLDQLAFFRHSTKYSKD